MNDFVLKQSKFCCGKLWVLDTCLILFAWSKSLRTLHTSRSVWADYQETYSLILQLLTWFLYQKVIGNVSLIDGQVNLANCFQIILPIGEKKNYDPLLWRVILSPEVLSMLRFHSGKKWHLDRCLRNQISNRRNL